MPMKFEGWNFLTELRQATQHGCFTHCGHSPLFAKFSLRLKCQLTAYFNAPSYLYVERVENTNWKSRIFWLLQWGFMEVRNFERRYPRAILVDPYFQCKIFFTVLFPVEAIKKNKEKIDIFSIIMHVGRIIMLNII